MTSRLANLIAKSHRLGITGSFFCAQECFKSAWVSIKPRQVGLEYSLDISENAQGYTRKGRCSSGGCIQSFPELFVYRNIASRISSIATPDRPTRDPETRLCGRWWKHVALRSIQSRLNPLERLRDALTIKILTPEEQESMRTVCRLSREVLDIAAAAIRPGITTDEIDAIVHEETIKRGAYPSPLNYREFPKSVCTSVNEVICHGIPDQRKLEEGDIVNLDVSLYYKGFHGDLNETYPVGKISEESQKLIRTTRQCLDAAIALCKPGTLFRDLGKAIEPIARAQGCSVVRAYTGHGIHHLFHTVPNITHYAKNKMPGMMKPGMCFTIEPMINLGSSWEVEHWPDNWTAVTIDGKRSAQFEETLLVTETGVEVLTAGKPREDLK
ncbi:unnamed protein product [Rhizoctonia solani]|uniref:Methionine aminopeptidase n=2 Tax=Rhizoctonia solani TaxID=456999 RepID=A0A8H3HKW3_9AGAM|nr:unnamed protein product [Rhizoctonia solani]